MPNQLQKSKHFHISLPHAKQVVVIDKTVKKQQKIQIHCLFYFILLPICT